MNLVPVLLVQNILTPYRLPFFQHLALSPSLELTIAYDRCEKDGNGLENIHMPSGLNCIGLKNVYLGHSQLAVYQRGFLSQIHSGRYRVIIAAFNPRIISNVLAWIYSRCLPVKFIWWGHGMSPHSSPLAIRLRLLMARYADAIIFYDSTQADRFVSLGIPQDKVFVAPNSIDTEEIEHLATPHLKHQRYRVLYVGRLIPAKKVDLLIRGFASAYPRLDPKTILTIVGDGPEYASLADLAQRVGLGDHIEFVGSNYQQELLAPLFNSAWVSVSPGYVGLSAIHSLAYGLPMIVAENEPHSPEVAALSEGTNCLFFSSDDSEALANRLVELICDQERWDRMSEASSRTIREKFNLSVMTQAFEQAVAYALGA